MNEKNNYIHVYTECGVLLFTKEFMLILLLQIPKSSLLKQHVLISDPWSDTHLL